jgi:hypothetical protein
VVVVFHDRKPYPSDQGILFEDKDEGKDNRVTKRRKLKKYVESIYFWNL